MYATFKMRGVAVNVNYRYLEDELVYLLDNSDAEALLLPRSLGERVAKVRERAPQREALDPGRRRLAAQDFAVDYEELARARTNRCRASSARGDDLYFLYTGGTTGMPKGVMWRNEDLCQVLGDGVYPLAGAPRPDTAAERSARSRRRSSTRAPTACICPRRRSCTAPARSRRSRRCSSGRRSSRSSDGTSIPHELWQTVQRERVTQMAIVGDAFAKPMLRALEEAEAKGAPTTSRRCSSSSARA